MSDNHPEFLTLAEAAKSLSCSPRQVVRLIESGRLRAVDIGTGKRRNYRVSIDSLHQIATPVATQQVPMRSTYRPKIIKL